MQIAGSELHFGEFLTEQQRHQRQWDVLTGRHEETEQQSDNAQADLQQCSSGRLCNSCLITQDGYRFLSDGLCMNSTLEKFVLSMRVLDVGCCAALGVAICDNATITHLELSRIEFQTGALKRFAASLGVNSTLTTLDLSQSGSRIGTTGFKSLGDALRINTTLEVLDFNECETAFFVDETIQRNIFYVVSALCVNSS